MNNDPVAFLFRAGAGIELGGGDWFLILFPFFFFLKPARTTGSVGERAGPHLDCLSF